MNIKILPLSEIQSFVHQKCLLPQELFPKTILPGALAKCRDSAGGEYICNIFPMTNKQDANFCWLDDTVKVGSIKNNKDASLTSLQVLHSKVLPASKVDLVFKITEKLFEIKKDPNRDLLAAISKQLLQPYAFVNNCTIELEELRNLGISEIQVGSKDLDVFSVTNNTEIIVSNILLQASGENYSPTKMEGLETTRSELQQLIRGASICANLRWKMKPSLNALIVGPPGSGKSSLCMNFILENNCNSFVIRLTNILGQYPGETEAELRRIFNSVKRFVQCFKPNDPMVILMEDLELICPGNKNMSSESANSTRISGQLISLLDHLHYSNEYPKIIVLATTSNLEAINSALLRPGRFGLEINIPQLSEEQRGKIFRSILENSFYGKNIEITDDIVDSVAQQTHGFVAADLVQLVHSIGQEFLRKEANFKQFMQNLEKSLRVLKPSSSQGTDVVVYKTIEKFDTIGGMDDLKRTLQVSVLAGLKQKAAFERFALCLPNGILLYGPPGCAKTTIAKCLATEANMTFIPTSAADVYSPYVGNSEKYMTKIFDTARKNSPCLVFLDEIDSLVGKRTADAKSDLQTRILSTLLTEMDGIGAKLYSCSPGGNDILVVAATNRPDMIDDALMRPGRFDKLIHVPAPDYESRLKILQIYAGKMPFDSSVNTSVLANDTDYFSGADICNLCNEAAMAAFTRDIDAEHITMADFKSVLKYQKSSLTQEQIQWYIDFERTYRNDSFKQKSEG